MTPKISKPVNPFPPVDVLNIEGRLSEPSLAELELCTYEHPVFYRARKLLEAYLHGTRPDGSRAGAVVGISGSYGSGKTHLIAYLLSAAWERGTEENQVYVRVQSANFVALYRQIMDQIDAKTLRTANTNWLSRIAQEEAADSNLTRPAVEILEGKPELVYEYLRRRLLSPSSIESRYGSWLHTLARSEELLRAASYLFDDMLYREAHRWFQGRKLDDDTMEKLGVRARISDHQMATKALVFVLTLLGKAHSPLLLYIDQVERLFVEGLPDQCAGNIGAVESLAEVIARERGFLVLSGTPETWRALPRGFLERLSHPLLELKPLSLDEATSLIEAYLGRPRSSNSNESEEGVCAFLPDAIREVVRLSEGNVRRILRLCFLAYEDASPNSPVIGKQQIERISEERGTYFDVTTIAREIRGLVREENLAVEEALDRLDRRLTDLVILRQGKPVAHVRVCGAMYGESATQDSLELLCQTSLPPESAPDVKSALIVAGYVASEVAEKLRQLVDWFDVYSPRQFRSRFLAWLRELVAEPRVEGVSASMLKELRDSFGSAISELTDRVEHLLQARAADSSALDARPGQRLEQQYRLAEQHTADDAVVTYRTSAKQYGIAYRNLEVKCEIRRNGSAIVTRMVTVEAFSDIDSLDTFLLSPEAGDYAESREIEHVSVRSRTPRFTITLSESDTYREHGRLSTLIRIVPQLDKGQQLRYEMVESLRPGTFAVDLTKEEVEQRSKADEYFGWAISRPTARLSLAVYYPRGVEPTDSRHEVRYASAAPGIPSSALQITEQGRVRKPSLDGPEDGAYGLKWDVDFPAVGLIYILVWAPLSSA